MTCRLPVDSGTYLVATSRGCGKSAVGFGYSLGLGLELGFVFEPWKSGLYLLGALGMGFWGHGNASNEKSTFCRFETKVLRMYIT